MNSSTEFSLHTQLLLDELRKLRKLMEASRIEASRCVSAPTPAAVVATDDNWGGLFDGDDDSIEQHCATQPIVADNWGGLFAGGNDSDEQHYEALIVADNWGELFERPAHEPEEHGLSLSAIDVFGSNQIRNGNNFTSTVEYVLLDASEELVLPLPCGSKSASLSSELESGLACPEQLHVDAAVTKYTCTDPDALLEAGQKLTQSGPIDIALDAACASAPSSTTVSDDVLALVDLKSGLSDPASRLALWSEDADRVCAWQGKSCDPHTGRVAALDLPAASFARRLTRSALLRLGALVSLTLPGNRLFVTLPDVLPPHIRALDVSGNAISGGIRALFVSCESLNLPPPRCSMQVCNNNGRVEITTEANVTEVRAVFRGHTSTLRPMRPWPPPTELRLPSCDAGLRLYHGRLSSLPSIGILVCAQSHSG